MEKSLPDGAAKDSYRPEGTRIPLVPRFILLAMTPTPDFLYTLLEEQLQQWQCFYNQERAHSAIASKTPSQRFKELVALVPSMQAVKAAYVPLAKRYVTNNWYAWVPKDNS